MKIIIMLLFGATAIFCSHNINGQTTIGVKGGVNVAGLTDSYKQRISMHGGIYINRAINKYVKIQPEVFFSGEGQKAVYNGAEYTWALDYIQVPLMIQVYPIKEVFVEVGPQVGFLISAKEKLDTRRTHVNIEANIANVQFALAAGLGVRLTDLLSVYGRYNFGFTDITVYDAIIHHMNVGQIGVAIRLYTF